MAAPNEVEIRLATTLSPILVAVGVLCLTLMTLPPDPAKTFIDEMFMAFGLLSLVSAALTVDSLLDKQQLKLGDRITLMNGGYLVFSIVIGFMSAGILLFYYTRSYKGSELTWNKSLIPFLLVGLFIVCKLMSHKDAHGWTAAIVGALAWSIYTLSS